MHPEDTSTSMVEGISDNVLFLCFFSLSTIVGFYLWSKFQTRTVVIHPDHHDAVQMARDQVNRDENNLQLIPRRPRNEDDQCPVCIDHLQFAVETNCGHIFCCSCITAYWEHGSWIGAMNCPVCRQQINVLLVAFTHEEVVSPEFQTHRNKILLYNRRFSGQPRPIWDYIVDSPVLARHLLRNFFTVSGVVAMLRLRILIYFLLVLVYIFSPLDIIPESIVGALGFVDDLAIALGIFVYVTVLFRQSLSQ